MFLDEVIRDIVVKNAQVVKKNEIKEDTIVSSVMFQLAQRSMVGQNKYGTTLDENDSDDFLEHLKQELLDAVLYIEKLKRIRDLKKQ
jgi:hypothetical protein